MTKTVIDSLQRLHDAFINEPDDWFFFLGLAEYMQFARSNDLTAAIIEEAVIQTMHDFDEKIEEAEKTVEEESLAAYKVIQERIETNKIEDGRLPKIGEELQAYTDGRIQSTATKGECFHRCVRRIIEVLRKLNQDELVCEYFVPLEGDPQYIRVFKISPSLEHLEDLRKEKEQSKRTEMWGSYWELERARWTIKDGLEYFKSQTGLRGSLNRMNASMMLSEMAEMERRLPNRKTTIFKKEEFAFHARRFHNYLLNMLIRVPESVVSNSLAPSYNNGILRFAEHEMELRKPEKHVLVISKLFGNPHKPVPADKMFAHVYEEERGKGDWKKMYSLIDRINDKIGKKIGVFDLIDHDKQVIRVKKDYLI